MAEVQRIGPYGGPGGNHWDIYSPPTKLVSVTIWSDDSYKGGVINGFAFTYVNDAKENIPSGPHGSQSGAEHTINLLDTENINRVSGTTDGQYVTSLNFVTDKGNAYGPFGAQSETSLIPFSFLGTILAFFGRSSEKLNAIGTYLLLPSMAAVRKIGPFGGACVWDICSPPKQLVSVTIWSVDAIEVGVINGLEFTYVNDAGKIITSGPHGTQSGVQHMISLLEDEHMISVSGTTDGQCVTSLIFVTDRATYGPYGAQSENGLSTFSFPGPILAFFGRSSDKIEAIGTYSPVQFLRESA